MAQRITLDVGCFLTAELQGLSRLAHGPRTVDFSVLALAQGSKHGVVAGHCDKCANRLWQAKHCVRCACVLT